MPPLRSSTVPHVACGAWPSLKTVRPRSTWLGLGLGLGLGLANLALTITLTLTLTPNPNRNPNRNLSRRALAVPAGKQLLKGSSTTT